MKTIIAGGRDVQDANILKSALAQSKLIGSASCIISGGASGVDTLAIRYAAIRGLPCMVLKANWSRYGKAAGPIRNSEMMEMADSLIAVWDGVSRGTGDMVNRWLFCKPDSSTIEVFLYENGGLKALDTAFLKTRVQIGEIVSGRFGNLKR